MMAYFLAGLILGLGAGAPLGVLAFSCLAGLKTPGPEEIDEARRFLDEIERRFKERESRRR
jgi:hypothetical protein